MSGTLAWIAAISAGGVALMLGFLYKNQNKLLYAPVIPNVPAKTPDENPTGYRNPQELGMSYENIFFKSLDNAVRLHAWFVKAGEDYAERPTVLFFHANAGNIGFRLPNILAMVEQMKCNVFIVDYRGYGFSNGEPDEEGIKLDGEASLLYLLRRDDINKKKIFIFGRSLGGAVAVHVASMYNDKLAGVVLENTFTSIGDMVEVVFPKFISTFKSLILRIDWNSRAAIKNVHAPLLFFSSDEDELVPQKLMRELYQVADGVKEKEFVQIKGGHHNDAFMKGGKAYFRKFSDFIDRNTLNVQDM